MGARRQQTESRFATMIRYKLELNYGDSDHINKRILRGVLGQFCDLEWRNPGWFSMWKGFEAVDRIGSRD